MTRKKQVSDVIQPSKTRVRALNLLKEFFVKTNNIDGFNQISKYAYRYTTLPYLSAQNLELIDFLLEIYTEKKQKFTYKPKLQNLEDLTEKYKLRNTVITARIMDFYANECLKELYGKNKLPYKNWHYKNDAILQHDAKLRDLPYKLNTPNYDEQFVQYSYTNDEIKFLLAMPKIRLCPTTHYEIKPKLGSYVNNVYNTQTSLLLGIVPSKTNNGQYDFYLFKEEISKSKNSPNCGSYEIKLITNYQKQDFGNSGPISPDRPFFNEPSHFSCLDLIRYDHNPADLHNNKLTSNLEVSPKPIPAGKNGTSHLHFSSLAQTLMMPCYINSLDALPIDNKGLSLENMADCIRQGAHIIDTPTSIYEFRENETVDPVRSPYPTDTNGSIYEMANNFIKKNNINLSVQHDEDKYKDTIVFENPNLKDKQCEPICDFALHFLASMEDTLENNIPPSFQMGK